MLKLEHIYYDVDADRPDKARHILSDVSLEFPDRTVTVITGHNGSGKSTLVKLIMGSDRPTSGKIHYDGERAEGVHPRLPAARALQGHHGARPAQRRLP